MYLFEKIRNKLFWFVDFMQTSKVKKHLEQIEYINDNIGSREVTAIREKLLENLLSHSVGSTKFYKKYKNFKKLEDFPIISKNIIRDNFSDFESSKHIDSLRYEVATSGSTGTPFVSYVNEGKKNRNFADTIYFSGKSGYELGYRLLYIRLWGDQYKKSTLAKWKQNVIAHNVTKLKDGDIKRLIEKLENDQSNYGIVAYASAFENICQYLDKIKSSPIKNKIRSIILISESVNQYTIDKTKYYFGIAPVSRYSNSENGIIAQQMTGQSEFKLNLASYHVEILDIESNEVLENGKLGRIVITDLFNKAVPMIRYDTGDLGIMTTNEQGEPMLKTIEGRKMDMIYDTSGNIISSHIVHQICVYKGILSYQLIQEAEKEYKFKIVGTKEFDKEYLINKYKEYFGDDAIIRVEMVDQIETLGSGKRKKVLNLFKNDK